MSLFSDPKSKMSRYVASAATVYPFILSLAGSSCTIEIEGVKIVLVLSRSSLAVQVYDVFEKIECYENTWVDCSLATVNEVYGYLMLWADCDVDAEGFVTFQDLIDFLD